VSAVDVALQSGPPGALAAFSDVRCSVPIASVTIAAGATRAAYRLRGAAAGAAWLRAVPTLLPSTEISVPIR
jgi:hypothetical protein